MFRGVLTSLSPPTLPPRMPPACVFVVVSNGQSGGQRAAPCWPGGCSADCADPFQLSGGPVRWWRRSSGVAHLPAGVDVWNGSALVPIFSNQVCVEPFVTAPVPKRRHRTTTVVTLLCFLRSFDPLFRLFRWAVLLLESKACVSARPTGS